VRNEKVLRRIKEERNFQDTLKGRETKWIGHILRKNWVLKEVIEGEIEEGIELAGTGGRKLKQLLDELEE